MKASTLHGSSELQRELEIMAQMTGMIATSTPTNTEFCAISGVLLFFSAAGKEVKRHAWQRLGSVRYKSEAWSLSFGLFEHHVNKTK